MGTPALIPAIRGDVRPAPSAQQSGVTCILSRTARPGPGLGHQGGPPRSPRATRSRGPRPAAPGPSARGSGEERRGCIRGCSHPCSHIGDTGRSHRRGRASTGFVVKPTLARRRREYSKGTPENSARMRAGLGAWRRKAAWSGVRGAAGVRGGAGPPAAPAPPPPSPGGVARRGPR